MRKLTIEDELGCNKFHTNETQCHIELVADFQEQKALDELARICPAALYKLNKDGKI